MPFTLPPIFYSLPTSVHLESQGLLFGALGEYKYTGCVLVSGEVENELGGFSGSRAEIIDASCSTGELGVYVQWRGHVRAASLSFPTTGTGIDSPGYVCH